MINWLRNWLMNPANIGYQDIPGDEIVPTDFNQITVKGVIKKLRDNLFGTNPDRAMLNYRMRQLLPLIHTTPLEAYVKAKDPRWTYLPVRDLDLYHPATFTHTTDRTSGTGTFGLTGQALPDEQVGIIRRDLTIAITATDTITITQVAPSGSTIVLSGLTIPTTEPQLHIVVPIPGLIGHIKGTVGDSWDVMSLCRSSRCVADLWIDVLKVMTPGDEIALFGAAPEEPYLQFRSIWRNHVLFNHKMSALLLALAYRTEEAANS